MCNISKKIQKNNIVIIIKFDDFDIDMRCIFVKYK